MCRERWKSHSLWHLILRSDIPKSHWSHRPILVQEDYTEVWIPQLGIARDHPGGWHTDGAETSGGWQESLSLQTGLLAWASLWSGNLEMIGLLTGQFASLRVSILWQNVEASCLPKAWAQKYWKLYLTSSYWSKHSQSLPSFKGRKILLQERILDQRGQLQLLLETIFHIGRGEWHWFFGRG